jgi:hypothetical protein
MATYFIDPGGETVELPDDQAGAALEAGYTPASPEQAADFQRRDALAKKYGTPGQAVLAGIEGAGRALTFGLSTLGERALGVDPEGIAAREEVNPVASAIGEVGGFVAPALATGGASLLGQGAARTAIGGAAKVAAPNIIGKAGRAVAGALEGAGAAGGTVLGQAARRGAATAAGGAVEGAALGAGEVVHRAALGDPTLTPASAAETIGLDALGGGVLGGVAGAAAGGLGAARRTLGANEGSAIGEKLADWLGEVQGTRGLKAAGAIQSDLSRREKQIGREELNRIGQEMFDYGLVGPMSTPASTLERARALQSEAGEAIGALVREADSALVPAKRPRIDDLVGRVRVEVLQKLKENPLQQDAANRLADVLEAYEVKFSGGLGVEQLHGLRRQLDDAIYGLRGTMDPYATPLRDALHDFRRLASEELDNAVQRAGLESETWKAAKRAYQVAATAEEFATRGVQRAEGNNLVSLTELMGGLSGGVAAGPLAGLAAGAGTALARRQASGIIGAGAGFARDLLRGGRKLPRKLPDVPPPRGPSGSGIVRADRPGQTRLVTPLRPQGEPAHYDVVEADLLIPSHRPQSFAPNPDYPMGVQERLYQSAEAEQKKVMKIGDRLDPSLVLADTPTAVDGPPIVTSGGRRIVLGGNGRTMGIQRGFSDPAVRENYRAALLERAPAFGIDPARVQKMKAPVLVRVAEDVPSTASPNEMVEAVRRYNEGLTQALSPRAKAVAQAKTLRPTTIEGIGDILASGEERSLRELMRERPRDFIAVLQRDGVINDTNRAAMVTGENLTAEAKDAIEGMFLGRVVGTGERLEATAASTLNKLERITPSLLRVEAVNPELSEIETVRAAIDVMNRAARSGMTVEQLLGQGTLRGVVTAERPVPAVLGLVRLLEVENQTQLGARFRRWAQEAAVDPRQGLMFAKPPTATGTRRTLFDGLGMEDEALAARVVPPPPPVVPSPEEVARAAEEAVGRPPAEVGESVVPEAVAGVLSDGSGGGFEALAGKVSPRVLDAVTDIRAREYATTTGLAADEVRKLLRDASRLGLGGPFTSAEVLAERAGRMAARSADAKARAQATEIAEMAGRAAAAGVDIQIAPLVADVMNAASSSGPLGGMVDRVLREVRARLGPESAAVLAPALRKLVRASQTGLVPPGPLHEEQARAGGAPHLAAPLGTVAALAVLDRHAETTQARVEESAAALVSGRPPATLRAPLPSEKEIRRQMDTVRRLAANPERGLELVDRYIDPLGDHAPQAAQVAATSLGTAMTYLAAQLPVGAPPSLWNPEPGPPNKAAVYSWGRKAQAILDPLAVLASDPSADAVAAIRAVYPKTWESWRASTVLALAQAAVEGKPPPFQTLQRVSTVIGQPLVPGQQPEMLRVAPAPATAPQPHGMQARPSAAGLQKADFGAPMRTGTQATMSGRG